MGGYRRDRERSIAYHKVDKAIDSGVLTRPLACPSCGADDQQVHAHHYAGYHRPLTIAWLCPRCHKAVHRDLLSVPYVAALVDTLWDELQPRVGGEWHESDGGPL